jgi:carboxyl-terminal processing protease
VIRIPSFYRDFRGAQRGEENFKSTSRDVEKVLSDFRDQGGVDVVVVDLRFNGGGALSEAIEVSGLFIDEGPIVQVKDPSGEREPHRDPIPGVAYKGPLIVVCNRMSASASEIFAGVIKDYGRGIIVGDTSTHGKGTVQNVMNVSRSLLRFLNPEDRGALKLTISQFYRVNGDSTQNEGVKSDIVIPSLLDHFDVGESFLDNALAFDQIQPAEYTALDFATPEMLSTLRQQSQRRVNADPEFQKLLKDIDRYEERKKKKAISLNLETRRREKIEEEEKNKKKEEETAQESDTEGPVFDDDHYNNEILRIGVDYAGLLKGLTTAKK